MYHFNSNIKLNDKWFADEPNISENEGDEVLHIQHAFSSDSEDSGEAVPSTIKTVWETKKRGKIVDEAGCRMLKCPVWSERNRTKAWNHIIGGRDVAICKSSLAKWRADFAQIAAQMLTKRAE